MNYYPKSKKKTQVSVAIIIQKRRNIWAIQISIKSSPFVHTSVSLLRSYFFVDLDV